MATLKLTAGSLSGTLWASNREPPQPKSNGQFLHIGMDSIHTTCVASDVGDVMRHGIGASDGSLFLLHWKRNRVAMIAKLPQAVTSIAFATHRRDHIFCASMQNMFLVNVETCRIEKKTRAPHLNQIIRALTHEALPTTVVSVSSDTIALWDANQLTCRHNTRESLKAKSTPAKFIDAVLTEHAVFAAQSLPSPTCPAATIGAIVKLSSGTLEVMKRVVLGKDRVPGCVSTVSPHCIVAGNANAPELLVFDNELNSVCAVMLPGSASVKKITVVDVDLIAAQTADGRVWFVVVSQYSVSFSLALPFSNPVIGIAASHATYLTVATAAEVYVYHLPSVKRFCDRTTGQLQHNAASGGGTGSSTTTVLPFVRTVSDTTPDVAADVSESYEAALPRQPMQADETIVTTEWVKANLVSHHDATSGAPRTLLLHDAVKALHNESIHKTGAAASSAQHKTGAAPKEATGHSLNRAAASSGKSDKAPSKKAATSSSSAPSTALPRQANITVRSFLDHESRAVNMDKLRVMLMRYGMYPEKYRTLIWRFLLQLPEKRFLAPQYQALTEKGAHPGIETLMEPFPLPHNKQRATFEAALSALAWNSPVLSVVHFVPNLVYPFVQLYGSDTQSAIEVFMAVLTNWGKEFFSYYPHHPVAILSFLNHTLKSEDLELHQHLEECGVSVENWGWEVLRSLYTEVLTRNEWLQVMDHAFSNEPIWLFLFHVRWIIQLREVLLQLHDYGQLVAMFRKTTPTNLNTMIHQAYQLRQRCPLGTIVEPYLTFRTFREYAYPVVLECDEAVITTKLRELERIAGQQEEAKASQKLVIDIKGRIAQAAMLEDAFVGKQRAMVAAKMEAANESWVQQVQLEKERQRLRDIEHETRLMAMQEQLRSAQRLEGLQHEVNAASQSARDADVDRRREVTKWDFSDRMSTQEMTRLEAGARLKLQTMLKTTAVLADGSSADVVQLAVDENAVPQVLPDSLIEEHLAAEHLRKQQWTAPPPLPVVQSVRATNYRHDREALSPPHRDNQTMTELPPLPPASSSSSCSAKPASHAAPQPHVHHHVAVEYKGGSEDSEAPPQPPESGSTSTCASDPLHYYQQLQRTIQQGVARAQREQKQRLEALESRFARHLGSEGEEESGGSSELTEVAVADTTSTAETSSGGGSRERAAHRTTTTTTTTMRRAQQQQQQHYDLHDDMADDDVHVSRSNVVVGQQHHRLRHSEEQSHHMQHATDESCSLLASSGASTSMTKALLRPQNPDFFNFKK